MKESELIHLLIALLVLTIVISFKDLVQLRFISLGYALLISALLISVNIGAKKWAARSLDANVHHELWFWSRFGFKPSSHTPKPWPLGVILPLVISAFSIGAIKCMTLMTFETTALKKRAARRFGYYSFTEMTDWHNALVGAAGIVGVLLLAITSYFIPLLGGLPTLATYYAFWNMIPFSKLDGAQIFFGSRVLYTTLALVTLVMVLATLVIR